MKHTVTPVENAGKIQFKRLSSKLEITIALRFHKLICGRNIFKLFQNHLFSQFHISFKNSKSSLNDMPNVFPWEFPFFKETVSKLIK